MKCELSACYSWKRKKVRHLEFGRVETDLSEAEMLRLQNDPEARVQLFKQLVGCEVNQILRGGVKLSVLPS